MSQHILSEEEVGLLLKHVEELLDKAVRCGARNQIKAAEMGYRLAIKWEEVAKRGTATANEYAFVLRLQSRSAVQN